MKLSDEIKKLQEQLEGHDAVKVINNVKIAEAIKLGRQFKHTKPKPYGMPIERLFGRPVYRNTK